MAVAGLVGSRERVGENPGGDQGAERRHSAVAEQRAAGGGAHHGVGEPQELHSHPGDLHDGTHDDHHAADAVRLPPRVRPQGEGQHRLTDAPQLVHADRSGQFTFKFNVKSVRHCT